MRNFKLVTRVSGLNVRDRKIERERESERGNRREEQIRSSEITMNTSRCFLIQCPSLCPPRFYYVHAKLHWKWSDARRLAASDIIRGRFPLDKTVVEEERLSNQDLSMESRTAHAEGRSWALLRCYTASEGLELGQQGVATHNELGHAFTNVSTRPTIDRVPTLYLYIFSPGKRDGRETNGNFINANKSNVEISSYLLSYLPTFPPIRSLTNSQKT